MKENYEVQLSDLRNSVTPPKQTKGEWGIDPCFLSLQDIKNMLDQADIETNNNLELS